MHEEAIHALRNHTRRHAPQPVVAYFLTETSDIAAEKLRNITSNIQFVESTTKKQCPSWPTGREVMTTSSGR